jgi:hypothetical protein
MRNFFGFLTRGRGKGGVAKLKQHVWQIDDDPTRGFPRLQVAPLQFFQQVAITRQLLPLFFDRALLFCKRLLALLELIAYQATA